MGTTEQRIEAIDKSIADLVTERQGLLPMAMPTNCEAKRVRRRELQEEYVGKTVRIRGSMQGRVSNNGESEYNVLVAVAGVVLDVWDGYGQWWAKVRVELFDGNDLEVLVRLNRTELTRSESC